MEIGAKKKKRATMSTSDSLICGKLRETESRMMVARGWEGEYREMLVEVYKLYLWVTSEDQMYDTVRIVNNTVPCTWNLIRVNLKYPHQKIN